MQIVESIFAIVWAAFWLYWLGAALSTRRGHVPWSRQVRIRALIVVAVILLVHFGLIHLGASGAKDLETDPSRAGLGLLLLGLGLSLAIWARVSIGRNWGTPMSRKDDPELVTSGPYRLVRHPIYSGILVAGVGTAVALDWQWLIAVGLIGAYFVYSALVEERFMTERFPEAYPRYRDSTRMLIPFVL